MDLGVDDDVVELVRHKLEVSDFYRMAEAGILGEDDRVELIDGELIDMAPIGNDHVDAVNGLTETLVLACVGRAVVSVQNPMHVDPLNEPLPDFVVFRLRAKGGHAGGAPWPSEVLLLIEVADTSLAFDRKLKRPIYARAGIPEYWIVDLKRRMVEVHRDPAGGEYATMQAYGPNDAVALAAVPEVTIRLDRVFQQA